MDPWQRLREATDYRSFLRAYTDIRAISLSELARASGFGRSFPSDVLTGKRRVTAQSCYKFEKGMKALPGRGKKLFRLLVALEEPDTFPALQTPQLEQKIRQLQEQSWQSPRRTLSYSRVNPVVKALSERDISRVYAASGTPQQGATWEELLFRTGLSESRLKSILGSLLALKLLTLHDERYTPQDSHLFLQSKKENDTILTHQFTQACQEANKRIRHSTISSKELFFTSDVCVSEDRLPELKEKLRQTILEFTDTAISPQGDKVVSLLTAFFTPSSEPGNPK